MPGILALLAHPDDELFCVGLLASAHAQAVPIHLAYWTRGEGSGSTRQRLFWRALPRAWHYRAREARQAAAILGAESVTFLGAIDPAPTGGWRAPEVDLKVAARQIEAWCASHDPELLLTHGSDGEYGHPAHRRLHEAALAAAGAPMLSFAATLPGAAPERFWNRSDPADYVLDSERFAGTKMEVLRAHRSQRGVFERLADPDRPSVRRFLQGSRLEGYRAWGEEGARTRALSLLRRWAGPGDSLSPA